MVSLPSLPPSQSRSLSRKTSLGGGTIGDHTVTSNALMAIISNIRMGDSSDGGALEGGGGGGGGGAGIGGGGPGHRPKSAAARRTVKNSSIRSKRATDSMGGGVSISVANSANLGSHASFTSRASSMRRSHAFEEAHSATTTSAQVGTTTVMFADNLTSDMSSAAAASS